MELITIEKNDLLELLNQANQPLLEKIDNLEKTIESLRPANQKETLAESSRFLKLKRTHLISISYIEGEQQQTKRKKYPCVRIGGRIMYDKKVLNQIKSDLGN